LTPCLLLNAADELTQSVRVVAAEVDDFVPQGPQEQHRSSGEIVDQCEIPRLRPAALKRIDLEGVDVEPTTG
jgi:hypothetical protein